MAPAAPSFFIVLNQFGYPQPYEYQGEHHHLIAGALSKYDDLKTVTIARPIVLAHITRH